MYSLVDCNSFFCSVEKVFHPGLEGKPVCVLSNNDGCIVALTPEAKAVGLHRGDPIFKVEGIVKHYGVQVFSTNMQLYAAMSRRVTNILRKSIHHVENYSIDESFLDLNGYEKHFDLVELMRGIKERIKLWTDIPVSVGIAPSKTLAKMGSKFAKQYKGYNGVCMIDTEEKRRKALEIFDLSDVWGIGRRTFETLNYYGIHTPLEFADKSESWVTSHFHKPGHQTWLDAIYVPGIMYKKSGVIVGNITPNNPIQLDLFDTNPKRKERNDLMRVMDDINHRYGVKTLHLAVEGTEHQQWHVKCEHRSPNYLTNINEILTIKI